MDRKPISIGIDIGKKKCDYCVIDPGGKVLDRGQYPNTTEDAARTARAMARKYGRRKDGCQAACETTANMWNTTYDAFEDAGIPITLANTYRMSLISKTAKKTDRAGAEKIAQILCSGNIPGCYVPPAYIKGVRTIVRHHVRLVRDGTRTVNRIHGMSGRHNVTVEGPVYTARNLDTLEAIRLGSRHDEGVVQQCARQVRYLTLAHRATAQVMRILDSLILSSVLGAADRMGRG